MSYGIIIQEALLQSLLTIGRISFILIPIMVFLEIARKFSWLEKLAPKLEPALKVLKLPPQAAFPLLVGVAFGLVYGAGLIIEYSRRGDLGKRDLALVGVFLSINHGIVEDTVIFSALGANPLAMIFFRFLLAIIFTRAIAFFWDRNSLQVVEREA